MKERPILFTTEMASAVREGRKTQTRRIVNPQPIPFGKSYYGGSRQGYKWKPGSLNRSWNDDDKDPYRNDSLATAALGCECPYGKIGDRLWIREPYYQFGHWEKVKGVKTKTGKQKWKFVADSERVRFDAPESFRRSRGILYWHPFLYKRLARFMPRKYSRSAVEIEGVRVERLKEISAAECRAEGIQSDFKGTRVPHNGSFQLVEIVNFEMLWESINGADSWKQNPLVWVMEFKKL